MPKSKKKTKNDGFREQNDLVPFGMPPSHPAKQMYSGEAAEGGSPHRSLLRNQGNPTSDTHEAPPSENSEPSNLANHFPSAAGPDIINHGARHPTELTYQPEAAVNDIDLSSPNDIMTRSTMSNGSGKGYTMTGTMKRGKKGRDVVEVQVELSERELKTLKRTSKVLDQKQNECLCGPLKGPHILLFTVLFIPFAFLATVCVVFYVGTMCWYNIYLFLSEEKSVWHRVFLCPLLILSYPFLIVFTVLGIGLYGAFIQVSWWYYSWYKQIRDFDKGFFGCLCNKLGVPQCAPYEVVIIDDVPHNGVQSQEQENATSV